MSDMSWARIISRVLVAVAVFVGVGVVAQTGHDDSSPSSNAAHRAIECSRCHQAVAEIGMSGPTKSPVQLCRSCHNSKMTSNELAAQSFHRDQARPCNDCHSFHETSTISAAGRDFKFSRSSGLGLCVACHSGSGNMRALSEGHRLAANVYHSNNTLLTGLTASQACLVCHSENRTVQIDGLDLTAIPQFSERHMHPLGEVTSTGVMREGTMIRKVIDPRLRLFNNRIECQTCHNLTALTKFRLVEFESQQELCKGCHQFE